MSGNQSEDTLGGVTMKTQTQVFPKIEAPELRTYLREIFPSGKFRVEPLHTSHSGSTISISWAGPATDQVREAVEDIEPGSCVFTTTHFMSGAPGPALPGGVFFFRDREVFHQLKQSRGDAW